MSWAQKLAFKVLGEDGIYKIAEKAIDRQGMLANINRSLMKYVMPDTVINKIDDKAEQYIKHGLYGNSDVFSVLSWIASKSAEIPWKLYKINKDGEKIEMLSHEALDVWKRPNYRQGGHEFREEAFLFYLATGNSFTHGISPDNGLNRGKWKELFNLPAHHTEIVSGGWQQPIKSYKLHGDFKNENPIDPKTVLHMKTPNLEYEGGAYLYGVSSLRAAVMAVTSSNDAYMTKAATFQNKGVNGVISPDGKAEDEMFEGALRRIEQRLLKKYSGPHNAGKLAAVDTPIKWTPIGQSLVDLAILESIDADLRTICRAFKIDSKVLNDPKASTYNNVTEARKAAYTDAIMPMLNKFRDEVNRWFTPKFGEDLIMEPDYSQVPEMQEDLNELVTTLNTAWWISPNEKLRMMGKDEYPDPMFDKPWIPAGLVPLSEPIDDIDLTEQLSQLGVVEYSKNKNAIDAIVSGEELVNAIKKAQNKVKSNGSH